MDKYQEMRTILSGRVNFVNGAYLAAPSLWKASFVGMFIGSDNIKFRGIRRAVRYYQSNSVDAGIHTAKNIFEKLGRPIHFQSEPTLQACFLRNYLGSPIILTLGETNEGICIEAYTARTLLSGIDIHRAFQTIEKHLPEEMRPIILPTEEKKQNVLEVRESRKDQKTRKKMEKLEKRAERANARVQAAAQAAKQKDENLSE